MVRRGKGHLSYGTIVYLCCGFQQFLCLLMFSIQKLPTVRMTHSRSKYGR